jgi:XTP/dITP diphosphohydrolase
MVSTNGSKISEVERAIGLPIQGIALEINEIQSLDVEQVAREKALAAYAILHRPLLVDDTGLAIAALGGLPGALVTWFLSAIGPAGITALVRDPTKRQAVATTAIGYADKGGVWTFRGDRLGTIASAPRGEGGFGFDGIFIPDGQTKTYAEMEAVEKTEHSMRSTAIQQLRDFLLIHIST